MTLTEFLRARIAEDEAAAKRASDHPDSWGVYANDNYGHLLVQPSRVLAECEAQRQIVDLYGPLRFGEGYDGKPAVLGGDGPETYWDVLLFLALPYASHPDYQQEWKP